MAYAPTSVTVNGVDLETIGLSVERVEGLDDGGEVGFATVPVPGLAGQVILGPRTASVLPRAVTVTGHLLAETAAGVESGLRLLTALAGSGLVELGTVRASARMAVGYLTSLVEAPFPGQYGQPATRVTLRFTCPDPWRYDVLGTVVGMAVASARAACVLGTAPVKPVVRIAGAVTNPGLIYRDGRGVARQTLGYTITLGANDWMEHDSDTGAIRKSVAGTLSDAYSTWTTKSDGLLVLDPADADYVGSQWPTLEVTGSGATGEARYRKAWR